MVVPVRANLPFQVTPDQEVKTTPIRNSCHSALRTLKLFCMLDIIMQASIHTMFIDQQREILYYYLSIGPMFLVTSYHHTPITVTAYTPYMLICQVFHTSTTSIENILR